MSAPVLAATQCLASIYANRIRVSRLHSSGSLAPGAKNLYVTDSVIKVGWTPQLLAGQQFTGYNGSGAVCVYASEDDQILRYDLTLDLCTLDFELFELLMGGRTITQGGVTVGYADRPLQSGPPMVCFEAWSTAYVGNAVATADNTTLFFHHVWPNVKWTIGASTMDRAVYTTPVLGKGIPNTQMGLGPSAQWPTVITEAHAVFLDEAIPAAVCGYQALVVAGSAS